MFQKLNHSRKYQNFKTEKEVMKPIRKKKKKIKPEIKPIIKNLQDEL